jgi:ribosomal protein L40E
MVSCRYCGEELSEDANFCLKCGKRTLMGEEEGIAVPGDALTKVGQDVDEALQVAAKAISEAFTIAADSLREAFDGVKEGFESSRKRRPDTVFCSKCGQENPIDAKFCRNCGNSLE